MLKIFMPEQFIVRRERKGGIPAFYGGLSGRMNDHLILPTQTYTLVGTLI